MISFFRKFGRRPAINAASNFISMTWMSLLSILTIPIYIRLLGVSEWSVVAACLNLQIIANFVDVGFTQIVPRWIAGAADNPKALRRYFSLFSKMYLALGGIIFCTLQFAAGYLASDWFQVSPGRVQGLELSIRIVSFQILFQFLNNLPLGFWYGLQKQVLASVRISGFGTLKHITAFALLSSISGEAWIQMVAFSSVALVELLTNAMTLWKEMATVQLDTGSTSESTSFAREVTTLSGGILIGLTVSQLDRIVLSRAIPVEHFAAYTVAASFAFAFMQLQTPLIRACFPLIVRDIRNTGKALTSNFYRLVVGTFFAASLPAVVSSFFAKPILSLWLRDAQLVELGAPAFRLLLLAVALNTLYNCIYQIIIADGQSHLVVKINASCLLVAVSMLFLFGVSEGVLLGGILWLTTTFTQLALGLGWLFYRSRTSRRH